jgi:hypothetical protein
VKFFLSFRIQFAENVQANWQRGVLLHHDNAKPNTAWQPRREFENYIGNFLNICLTARTWPLVLKNHLGGECFADDEEVEMEVKKWLRQQTRDFYTTGFDGWVK